MSTAVFDTTIKNWGGIDVDTNFISTGYSSPKLIDSNGVYQLFVGSYSGTIYQFTNIDGNLTGLFSPVNSTISSIWDGGKCTFTFADINNDNQPEMIVGNLSGGIAYFSSDTLLTDTTSTSINNQITEEDLQIFPNPAKDSFTLKSKSKGNVTVKNLLGNTIYISKKNNTTLLVNTSNFPKGIYIIIFEGLNRKLIVE
jgi:hypothetical protein